MVDASEAYNIRVRDRTRSGISSKRSKFEEHYFGCVDVQFICLGGNTVKWNIKKTPMWNRHISRNVATGPSFHGFPNAKRDAKGGQRFHSSDEIQRRCVGFRLAHDTFIDPVASNVYESLFEGEDESADARQVRAGLSAPLFLPAPLMRIIRLSFFFLFISGVRYIPDPFRPNTVHRYQRPEPPAFLICFGFVWNTSSLRYVSHVISTTRSDESYISKPFVVSPEQSDPIFSSSSSLIDDIIAHKKADVYTLITVVMH